MRRFGEHLLSAIEHLEQEGVAHRDVKPDNIGIAKVAGTGAYRLVLFDFSLIRAPTENIRPAPDPISTRSWPTVGRRGGTFTRSVMPLASPCTKC